MRQNKLFILYSLLGILMASCIKDEAPNAEADITGIFFEEDVLASARFNLNPSYNDNLQAYPILVKVKEGTPLNKLSPLFELTPGAIGQIRAQLFPSPLKPGLYCRLLRL